MKFVPSVPGYIPQRNEVVFFVRIDEHGRLEMVFSKLWREPDITITGSVRLDARGVKQMDYDSRGWRPKEVEQIYEFARCLSPSGTRWVKASDYGEIIPGLKQCKDTMKVAYEGVSSDSQKEQVADAIFNLLTAIAWLERRCDAAAKETS